MKNWSEIKEYNGRNRIHIDGKPYLTLGIQYDYLNCTKLKILIICSSIQFH